MRPWWRHPTLVIAAGCAIAIVTFGARTSFGLFTAPLSDLRGWDREAFAWKTIPLGADGLAEKVAAFVEAATTLATGGSAHKVLRRYRTHVQANERRLTRRKRRRDARSSAGGGWTTMDGDGGLVSVTVEALWLTLRVAGLPEPRREAGSLVSHATVRDSTFLITHADEALTPWWVERGIDWRSYRGCQYVVVASTLEWRSSARYGETVEVDVEVEKLGRTSLTLRFVIRVGPRVCCEVRTTYVCTAAGGPTPWPDGIRALISAG